MNDRAKIIPYLKGHFVGKLLSGTDIHVHTPSHTDRHTHRHTDRTDYSTRITKMVGNKLLTTMSVLLVLGQKCTLAASCVIPWRVTLGMRRVPY